MDETETQSFRQVFEKISTDLNRVATVLEAGRTFLKGIDRLVMYTFLIWWALFVGKAIVQWQHVSAGTHCVVGKDDVFGVTELQAKTMLEQALKAKDDLGVQDLITKGKAVRLPRQTQCLVLDSTGASDSDSFAFFLKDLFDFSFYRKIRVLSGDEHGKAVWIPTFALQVSPPGTKGVAAPTSDSSKNTENTIKKLEYKGAVGYPDEEIRDDEVQLHPGPNSQGGLPTKKDGGIDWSKIKVVPKK